MGPVRPGRHLHIGGGGGGSPPKKKGDACGTIPPQKHTSTGRHTNCSEGPPADVHETLHAANTAGPQGSPRLYKYISVTAAEKQCPGENVNRRNMPLFNVALKTGVFTASHF